MFVFLSHSKGDFGPDYTNPQPNETYYYLRYLKWDDAAKERVQREMDEATHYEQYCIETGGPLAGNYSNRVCMYTFLFLQLLSNFVMFHFHSLDDYDHLTIGFKNILS